MQGVWVSYLVGELRSHMPHSHKNKKYKCSYWGILGDDGDRQAELRPMKILYMYVIELFFLTEVL